jgi:hypothetical protein
MSETRITIPELALVGGTRVALGAGLGLLLGARLSDDQRRAVGWTLFLIGALTTVPLAFEIFGGQRLSAFEEGSDRDLGRYRSGTGGRLGRRDEPART